MICDCEVVVVASSKKRVRMCAASSAYSSQLTQHLRAESRKELKRGGIQQQQTQLTCSCLAFFLFFFIIIIITSHQTRISSVHHQRQQEWSSNTKIQQGDSGHKIIPSLLPSLSSSRHHFTPAISTLYTFLLNKTLLSFSFFYSQLNCLNTSLHPFIITRKEWLKNWFILSNRKREQRINLHAFPQHKLRHKVFVFFSHFSDCQEKVHA